MDTAGRLSFPALDRWAPGQSSLARVVTEATGSLSGQTARADSSPSPSRSGTQPALPTNIPSMASKHPLPRRCTAYKQCLHGCCMALRRCSTSPCPVLTKCFQQAVVVQVPTPVSTSLPPPASDCALEKFSGLTDGCVGVLLKARRAVHQPTHPAERPACQIWRHSWQPCPPRSSRSCWMMRTSTAPLCGGRQPRLTSSRSDPLPSLGVLSSHRQSSSP